MKRIFILSLVVFLLGTSSLSFAQDYELNNKLDYIITESIDENNVITRSYENLNMVKSNGNNRYSQNNYKEIKNVLRELGMEEVFIKNLSEEDLKYYSGSPKIIGSISYTKGNSDGKVEYLPEKQAIEEVENIKLLEKISYTQEGNIYRNHEQDTYQDSYMRVFHMVAQHNYKPEFRYSTDARWLIMPHFRLVDSIGSCAQYCAVIPHSERGFYSYSEVSSSNFVREDFLDRDIKWATNGGFTGAAAKLYPPSDIDTPSHSISYYDLFAHFQFEGRITEPDHTINFNSIGTYDHAIANLSLSASISISLTGPSASIGFGMLTYTDARSARVIVKYTPNN